VNYASRRDRRKSGFFDFYLDDDNDGEVDYNKHYNREGDSLFVSEPDELCESARARFVKQNSLPELTIPL
jgi:hypothetical protein